jgi:GntR family transcriptional regulator, transcriptional repressor for pyruvate dehydrogenase complex
MGFDRVARLSQVDAAADAIERSILAGEVRAGECLPPERELAAKLGVARLTLRAALVRVAATGLIAPRHGHGTVVLNVAAHGTPALLGHYTYSQLAEGDVAQTADDLLTIRRGLAHAVLERLASTEPTPKQLDDFDDALDPFEDLVASPDRTSEMCANADQIVVTSLVLAANLVPVGLFLNQIFATLRLIPALRDAIYADPAENVRRWRDVGDWLRTPKRRAAPLLAALAAHDATTVARLRPLATRKRK